LKFAAVRSSRERERERESVLERERERETNNVVGETRSKL